MGKTQCANLNCGINFEKYLSMRIATIAIFIFFAYTAAAQLPKVTPPKPSKVFIENLEIRNGVAYLKNKPYTGVSYKLWENKIVNEVTSWVDGLKDGEYKEFTEDNVLVSNLWYYQGIKHGEYAYFYPNGALKNKGTFYNGLLNGEIWGYYPNGRPQYMNTYTMGARNGKSHTWFVNGRTEQTSNFVNDVPDGEVLAWYPDSIPRYQTEYKAGIKNGRFYRFHKTGCPAEESYFKMGKKDSVFRAWDEFKCALIEEGFFANGEKNGTFIQYGFNGDTLKIENYKYNKLDGRFMQWQDRGLESSGYYKEGKPQGYWKYGMMSFYQMREGNYDNGIMVGLWKFYDNQGRLLARQWYDEEGEVTKSKLYKKPKKR